VILIWGAQKSSKTTAANAAQAKNGAANPVKVNLIIMSQGTTISGVRPI
jgi:hypothetical protein